MEVLDIGLGNIIFSAVVAIFLGGWLGILLWGAILMLLEKGRVAHRAMVSVQAIHMRAIVLSIAT